MIIKSYDIKNYLNKNSIFLFYGENDGLKDEIIDNFFKKNHIDATFNYSEKNILPFLLPQLHLYRLSLAYDFMG